MLRGKMVFPQPQANRAMVVTLDRAAAAAAAVETVEMGRAMEAPPTV
jgi:hypothetical protein